jgi:hypothetical protein
MFTITLPPVLHEAAEGRDLAATVPDDGSAAHVAVDARLVALADSGFVGELVEGLMARGLEVLVVDGAPRELRGVFRDAADARRFDELWFQTDSASATGVDD